MEYILLVIVIIMGIFIYRNYRCIIENHNSMVDTYKEIKNIERYLERNDIEIKELSAIISEQLLKDKDGLK